MFRKRQQVSERAQRFPIHLPVRYRIPHSSEWIDACTENVSRSGVVFRTDRAFESNTSVDLRLQLPPTDNNEGVRGEIACKGDVVRVEKRDPSELTQTVAVAFRNYRFMQKREPN